MAVRRTRGATPREYHGMPSHQRAQEKAKMNRRAAAARKPVRATTPTPGRETITHDPATGSYKATFPKKPTLRDVAAARGRSKKPVSRRIARTR